MRSLSFLAFSLFAVLTLPSVTLAEGKTVRILTIGNSFSRNATNHLDDLAKADGHTLIHRPIVVGGASLELHATRAQKHEADPMDKAGHYTNGRSLKDELLAEKWDYVTIQQASIKSHDPATYQPFADWLAAYIAKHAPTAKLLIHQTWAYRVDDPRFTKPSGKPGEPKAQEEMYRGLTNAYRDLAEKLGAGLLPVGDAFFLADTDATWGFKPDTTFDPKMAKAPSLPDQTQSLHVGWRWVKPKEGGEAKLQMDGHHANLAGEYLGACVWYEVLFGESVVGNAYVPEGLEVGFAKFLRETAHRAVGKK
jgi:hypothetical protein